MQLHIRILNIFWQQDTLIIMHILECLMDCHVSKVYVIGH